MKNLYFSIFIFYMKLLLNFFKIRVSIFVVRPFKSHQIGLMAVILTEVINFKETK